MPELAEVEVGRKVAASALEGRRIIRVVTAEDRIVFSGVAPSTFARRIRGRVVERVHRKGKLIWFEMDGGPWPSFHFGMTGAFRVPDDQPGGQVVRLATGPRPAAEWPPRFAKVHMFADDGAELVMTNARRLGRIRLHADLSNERPFAGLGFDPLLEPPTEAEFTAVLSKRRGPIKAVLMDQKVAAGIGNWLADEILYQSGVDPRRPARDLRPAEVRRVRAAMVRIVKRAVEVDAQSARFPRAWLFHRRWGKVEGQCTTKGEPIEFIEVGGRTTALVPARQR